MKAEDLAAYFAKKIAKPIPYDLANTTYSRLFYAIEPTAVSDGVLHVMVHLKHEMLQGHNKRTRGEHCGEAEIPLWDDDTVESVLLMAVAATNGGAFMDRRAEDYEAITDARADLDARWTEEADEEARPPGP